MPPLLLASASPRRRALLAEAAVVFETAGANVIELTPLSAPDLTPAGLAEANARLKAQAAVRPGRCVLGADTVVALDGQIFGKPESPAQARAFLRVFSGRTHEVITGCALLGPDGREQVFHEVTRVTFRVLDDTAIADYLTTVHVLDKAGGYALQEKGDRLVAEVAGSRSNVVGLPMERLLPLLLEHKLAP